MYVLPVPPFPPPTSKQGQFFASFFALEGRRELRRLQESESKKGLHEDLTTSSALKDKQLVDGIQSRDLANLDRT